MKRLLFLLFLFLFLSTLHIKAQEIFTDLSYEEAIAFAKKNKKSFFIDFTADWCFPCKVMDDTVFSDYNVIDYTKKNYIALQLDVNDFDAMVLRSEHKVKSLPTVLFFNYKGKLIGRVEGLQTGSKFIEELRKYVN